MSEAEAFEAALQANPDDLAGWCAYADYLVEQGDLRGEFMQVQIALEDENRPKDEREALKHREKLLYKKHKRAWLGELAPFVLDAKPVFRNERRTDAHFTRGWLTGLTCQRLSVNEVRTLARTPEAKFLSRLLVDDFEREFAGDGTEDGGGYAPGPDVPDDIDDYDGPALYALRHVPHLAGVRVFRLGDGPTGAGDVASGRSRSMNGDPIHEIVARMPRLEELYLYVRGVNTADLFALPLSRLRVLRVDHETSYPLEVLAANRSLGNLTHLLCYPHAQRPDDPDAYIRLEQLRAVCRSPHLTRLVHLQLWLTDFGNAGAEEIAASGVLKRLRVLDLAYGCITDHGAAVLAACPDLKNLALLDLSMNALTDAGIAALTATGVPLKTGSQHGEYPDRPGGPDWLEYLSYGDLE